MSHDTVNCFCCGKKLEVERVMNDGNAWPYPIVYDGLWFQSGGNYGSSIFDPIASHLSGGGEYLRLAICDVCVESRKNDVIHIGDIVEKTTAKSKVFEPHKHF